MKERSKRLLPFILLLICLLAPALNPAVADENTPAEFTVTTTVAFPEAKVPPIGINNFGSAGGTDFASNNLVGNPGNEPISFRRLFRTTNTGDNWFEVGDGGTSHWDLWGNGFLSGARARIYRIVDKNGQALPTNDGYLDLSTADHVELIRDTVIIPRGTEGFPDGGWIANQYTSPNNVGTLRHNLHYTDPFSIENGVVYWYVVKAVDAAGNESDLSEEVSVTPRVAANRGPRIIVRSTDDPPTATAGEAYNWGSGFTPEVKGGVTPLHWQLLTWADAPLDPPGGMTFDPDTGNLGGTPEKAIDHFRFRVRVTDASGRSDFMNFVLNPRASTGTSGDSDAPAQPVGLQAVGNNGSVTLTWKASPSADVVGYRVLRSTAPLARQLSRAYVSGTGPALLPHDYVFVEADWLTVDMDTVNPRVRTLANDGKLSWYWNPVWDADLRFSLVEHGSTPSAMFEPGRTCLKVQVPEGPRGMFQYTFIGTDIPGESEWYGTLEPGCKYRLEVWLRQSGLADGGRIRFQFSNDAYPAIGADFSVTRRWKKFTYDFTAPERPTGVWHFGPQFNFTGPGTFWMDNCRLFRMDSAADGRKHLVPNKTILKEIVAAQPASGRKGVLRIFGALYNEATMDSLLSLHSSSTAVVDWYCAVGGTGNVTLPVALETARATGANPSERMRPWLTLRVFYNEAEWLALVEYLAAPYDPAVDTPESKPYAYRRTLQRGTGTPWIDEFDEMYLEFGNESWHNSAGGLPYEGFGPTAAVWEGGVEYGLFSRHMFDNIRNNSPYWASRNLGNKIKLVLNGGYEALWDESSDGTGWYGERAASLSPGITSVTHANYVGPKWETNDPSIEHFDDAGVQETLLGYLTGWKDAFARQYANQQLMESLGVPFRLTAYEGGPSGYALPGTASDQATEVSQLYGKSLAMGVAALDTWLNAYHHGWTDQMYFVFSQGDNWSSHTDMSHGFRPCPGWLAMKLRNRFASGDLLSVETVSVPTMLHRSGEELPLEDCHVFRKGSRYAVIVYSRKLTGATPVTLHLPFATASSVTLHTLTGDPRKNNREAMNIDIGHKTLDASLVQGGVFQVDARSGGSSGGLPPGSIFLYVFDAD